MNAQPTSTIHNVDSPRYAESLASQLLQAEADRMACDPLTDADPLLSLELAYRIQDEALSQRIERGETITGIKLGLTSPAKQAQMGVTAPLTAWLTDAMVLPLGAPLPLDRLIHPRIEPEITFVMGRRLEGPGVTAAAALAAVDCVYASVEVIDSRYRDFRFTLPDVIADNASSAHYVTGSIAAKPNALDLRLEGCLLQVNGELVASGLGAAVQGHPAEALAMAANSLALRGHAIEPGWVVMTGGITDAVAVNPNATISAQFTHLGSVGITG